MDGADAEDLHSGTNSVEGGGKTEAEQMLCQATAAEEVGPSQFVFDL